VPQRRIRGSTALFVLCVLSSPMCHSELAESKRPITVEDCVRTRRILGGEIEISPDGESVAYVVKAPNVEDNKNEYLVYLRDLSQTEGRENGRLLADTEYPPLGLTWTYRNEKPVILYQGGPSEIVEADPATGAAHRILTSADPVSSFAVDATGGSLVYSTLRKNSGDALYEAYREHGYPVLFRKGIEPPGRSDEDYPRSDVYVARRNVNGEFSVARISNPDLESLGEISGLSLSPDGRYLVFSYKSAEAPAGWSSNPLFQHWGAAGGMLGLIDFHSGTFRIAFNSPAASWWLPVTWAEDSRAFTVNAVSPVGSSWDKRDTAEGFTTSDQVGSYSHSFAVDLPTGTITEISKHPALWYSNETLFWRRSDDRLLLRKDKESFAWLRRAGSNWEEVGESRLSIGPVNLNPSTDFVRMNARSDGKKVVGVLETRMTPPDLFVHDLSTNETRVLTDLNPEFQDIRFEPVEPFGWRDRWGDHCTGYLIKPPDYDPAKRYPLVIVAKNWIEDYFVADTQYRTAFAPQVLAASGFLVLMANERPAEFEQDRTRKYPGRHPGRMREAYQFMDVVKSAVYTLVKQGLADRNDVGIAGFSTTSWKTDILLTHAKLQFRAASSADSGLWNYGLYWLTNTPGDAAEEYVGGPPYGKTLKNWLAYSPAFNAQRVDTPLLMEYIEPPTAGLEFFVALSRQGKPVDLFFYPDGAHELDKPFQRVASLQRNVDWFRFWMQGKQSAVPSYDPGQYTRWSRLRHLQQTNERRSGVATRP
jgi:Prolyl oligopeptidase family